jgi:ACR3 family arsenite efflux pump ArsB
VIAFVFLGFLFKSFIGADALDFVKLPPGADWAVGRPPVPWQALVLSIGIYVALPLIIGVLIEVPVMLMLVRICLRTQGWFKNDQD